MQHFESTFKGARGLAIYSQAWVPDGGAEAVLLVVHGLAEHSGRYMNVVNHFVPRRYAVYALDHIGHGRSEGRRVYVERFTDFTETLATFSAQVREEQAGKPVVLVGHSMGGLISATYLLDHQAEFCAAVLSGPAITPGAAISGATIAAGKVLSALLPTMGVLAVNANDISRDPAVVAAQQADPLVYQGKTTARLGAETVGAMERVQAEAGKITLPLLILQGSDDRLVNPAGAQLLYQRAGAQDKTLKVYDGLYHEVFNEPEREMVLADMEAWLATRVPR